MLHHPYSCFETCLNEEGFKLMDSSMRLVKVLALSHLLLYSGMSAIKTSLEYSNKNTSIMATSIFPGRETFTLYALNSITEDVVYFINHIL